MPDSGAQSRCHELISGAIAAHDLGADPYWLQHVAQLPDGTDPGEPPTLEADDDPEPELVVQGNQFRIFASAYYVWVCRSGGAKSPKLR